MIYTKQEQEQFISICEAYRQGILPGQGGIGTLSEKTLHRVVKTFIEPNICNHEKKMFGYVADIVNEKGIIEIQTRNFGSLRKKLPVFLEHGNVTVVYPVAYIKWLCWIDKESGEIISRRKSPKRGSIYDISRELCYIRGLFTHPNFRLELIFMELEEYKILDGYGKEKKRGASWYDRVPLSYIGREIFEEKKDFFKFLPDDLLELFTIKELAGAIKKPYRTAQEIITILKDLSLAELAGKRGRIHLYRIVK